MPHKVSAVVGKSEQKHNRGQKPYDREKIYRWLYENSDSRGIVIFTQRQVSEKLDISYQSISTIYTDLIDIGYMKKHGRIYFEIIYDPDDLDWGEDFKQEQIKLRKRHQPQ